MRLSGVISVDLAVSPVILLAVFMSVLILSVVTFYGVTYMFISTVVIKGAREASINPDTDAIHSHIYDTITRMFPDEKKGVTLFVPNDVMIYPNDGEFSTVKAEYRAMLPGVDFYEKLGGNPVDWTIPVKTKFSYYREY